MAKRTYVLVLAGSPKQASTYARRMDLKPGDFRAVKKASSIRGIQSAECHILPEFKNRPDRFAILAELRHARSITYRDVEMPDPECAVVDGQPTLFDLTGSFEPPAENEETFEIFSGLSSKPISRHKSVDPEIEIVTPQSGKRRKRCKQCGMLTFSDYAVDSTGHAKEHH